MLQAYVDKTITGKEYNFDSAFEVYIFIKSDQILGFLLALGYELEHILGMSKSITYAWWISKSRTWVIGDDGTLDLVLMLLDSQDRNEEQQKLDRIVSVAVSALFCFDRALSTNRHLRPIVASKWLEAADELFFLSSRVNNLTEKQLKKEMASRAAFNSHKETYALKKQAKDYWREHIDPKLSNPKAADLLIKIVPVSHRKLAEYVAEAKREKVRSAS